ncbi:MAG: sulfatase-like hydrolase/transferase [Oscillospiraceae bacterium]
MNNKNLIFFMTDQQRADTVDMCINNVPVAPMRTKLSKDGAWFKTAYDACPLCVPARTALATGKEPLRSGMFLNDLKGETAPKLPTLHKMLYDAGYEVAHMGVNHITVCPPLKTSLPFAAWEDDDSYAEYAKNRGISIERTDADVTIVDELCGGEYKKRPYSNANVTLWQYPTEDFKDVWFCDNALRFINAPHEKPFALFVCLWAPHPPLKVPQEYLNMFPPESFSLPHNTGKEADGQPQNRHKGAAMQLGNHPPKEGWQEAWSAHCALTRLCDDQLARIVDAVNANGIADSTLMVCTTDHGEQLGQHGMYQKMEMYESAVRVPCVFNVPNVAAKAYDTAISHLDFVPTVLDLLDIPFTTELDGTSLAKSIINGEEPMEKDIFSVYCGNHMLGDMRRMIVRGEYKYIFDGEEKELYNLKTDAFEMCNLAGKAEYADICNTMHQALCKHFENTYDTVKY